MGGTQSTSSSGYYKDPDRKLYTSRQPTQRFHTSYDEYVRDVGEDESGLYTSRAGGRNEEGFWSYFSPITEYVAFVGACVDRKAKELNDYIDTQRDHDIYYSRRGMEERRKRRGGAGNTSARQRENITGMYNDFSPRSSSTADQATTTRGRRKPIESSDTTPLQSARGTSSRFIERDDHVLLSARSIAIQKKAPLFRDTQDESYLSPTSEGMLKVFESNRLNLTEIDRMIEEDKFVRNSRSTTAATTLVNTSPVHTAVADGTYRGNYRSQSPKIRAAAAAAATVSAASSMSPKRDYSPPTLAVRGLSRHRSSVGS